MKEQKKKSYPEKDIDCVCDRCRVQVSKNEFICPRCGADISRIEE